MDGEPGEGEEDDDDEDELDDALLVLDALGRGAAAGPLGPQTVQHDAVKAANQGQRQNVGRNEKRYLEKEEEEKNHYFTRGDLSLAAAVTHGGKLDIILLQHFTRILSNLIKLFNTKISVVTKS